ncbi:S8 family peptidase [Phascolarctobacterium succinatutens]|uniref:S8 family peptidase n=1 Tax=Phascolarctobacterium succinatutens TaxID=626940 RepID=UPI00307754CE
MMKRRHFNLIKTGRRSKLALAVGLALAMSAMGSVHASGNDDTFKNFANKDALMKTAEGFKTQEFKNSTGLEAIGADKAYALGYSGKGITVGMVDTPVYSKHSELSGDKKIQKYGYGSDDLFSIFNDRDHGTHVAGIIAANKDEKGMHGIAYHANLISLGAESSLFGEKKGFFNAYVSNTQNIKNIKIINNSWGSSTDHFDLSKDDKKENFEKEFNESAYYKNLAEITRKYDQINVYTSGNKGSIFSHAYTSGLGIFPEMKDNVLNVMAMNSRTSNLASMTCLAKNAEEWTVVAPGTGINSLDAALKYPFNNYIKKDGTSMAAPYVSGTLALIKEAFPYLSGKQIVETLLSTCNDKFLEDNYTVQLNTDENNNLVAINLVYIDELEKQSDENNKKALGKYYNATIKNETFFKTICDKYGIKNAEDFIRLFSENEIGKIYYLTGKEAYGYGMVDAGKAIQGIGKIITSRLKSQDKSNIFTKESDVYLYSVDTGKKDANYKNRDYTIWSNDIGEELSADGLHAGITKKGEVDLVLLGDNTYLGPTISKDGKIQIVRGVSGNTFAIDNGIIEINGKANEVYSLNGGSTVVKDNITQKEQKPLELYGRMICTQFSGHR